MGTYRMAASISGTRNGVDWPRRGQTVELPDDEAADYLAAGLVVAVEHDEAETATVPVDVETATIPRKRGSAKTALAAAEKNEQEPAEDHESNAQPSEQPAEDPEANAQPSEQPAEAAEGEQA